MYARDEHGTEHRVQVVKLCFIAYLDGIEIRRRTRWAWLEDRTR